MVSKVWNRTAEEEKTEGSGFPAPRKDLRIEAHRESKEKTFNEEEGGGRWHLLPEHRLKARRGGLKLQLPSDC